MPVRTRPGPVRAGWKDALISLTGCGGKDDVTIPDDVTVLPGKYMWYEFHTGLMLAETEIQKYESCILGVISMQLVCRRHPFEITKLPLL